MENLVILFWIVVISTIATFLMTLARGRSAAKGWLLILLSILFVLALSWSRRSNVLIGIGAGMWALLIVLPSLLARLYQKRLLEQRYSAAHWLARTMAWLHPFDGWREQPRIAHAFQLAQKGDLDRALEILNDSARGTSPAALSALINFYRISNRWEEFLEWTRQYGINPASNTAVLPVFLRSLGETGDLTAMIHLYETHQTEIAKLGPASSRDACRLALFAFCGRRDLVERLFAGSLAPMSDSSREFWLATAELAAGKVDSARQEFATLLETSDPSMRPAIERRLSMPLTDAASLTPAQLRVIEDAATHFHQDQVFGLSATAPIRPARATQILIALNVLMFAMEIRLGGATNGAVLYRLGALYPRVARAGEWWRLGAAMFLHFGALHLAMNMLALWTLGPFVEHAFRFGRFLTLYLVAGLGSMLFVMIRGNPEQITVGASGAIMGLVGATGALMLKGWLRHKAHPARQRLARIVMIVAVQTLLDSMIPQVSMAAHLSGVAIGFATGLILPDSLLAKGESAS